MWAKEYGHYSTASTTVIGVIIDDYRKRGFRGFFYKAGRIFYFQNGGPGPDTKIVLSAFCFVFETLIFMLFKSQQFCIFRI